MAKAASGRAATHRATTTFDPTALVTRKPNSIPPVYAHLVGHGPCSPKAIRDALDVTPSITRSALGKLTDLGLVDRPETGTYQPAAISLDPIVVKTLGELRSQTQYAICRLVAAINTPIDAGGLSERLDGQRSNLRATALTLHERAFLERSWTGYRQGLLGYRLTQAAKTALDTLDPEPYLGRDGKRIAAHPTGIGDTDFRTAYEIEDAVFMAETGSLTTAADVADALGKDIDKTRNRLEVMADRGLLESTPLGEKMVFSATDKTTTFVRHLDCYRIAREHGLDIYSIATELSPEITFCPDDLYTLLVERGFHPTPSEITAVTEDCKAAGLLHGNSRQGYAFSLA